MQITKQLIWFILLTAGLNTFVLVGPTLYAQEPSPPPNPIIVADVVSPTFAAPPLITPISNTTISTAYPTFDWIDATDNVAVFSYTLRLTGQQTIWDQTTTAQVTATNSIYTPTQSLSNGVYTWTVQAHDAAGNISGFVASYTFTVEAVWYVFLPIIYKPDCPTASNASFNLIPIEGGVATDHAPPLHGDLNLALRGYNVTSAAKNLVDYNGATDGNAPQLAGLFTPNQFPGISEVYQANGWNWACSSDGCPSGPITNPAVTLMALSTSPGDTISIPERGPEIYGGGYKAMVLYAEQNRITLGYTRRDSVVPGYTMHIENFCVDPNLLALYQAQVDSNGWHTTGQLPALKNDQTIGTARSTDVIVAIRDRGSFMDPRSRKDWWVGY